MGTIFTEQFPNGIIEQRVVLNNENQITQQKVVPALADPIVLLEPNPYVAWQLGDKVTIVDPTTEALQPIALDVGPAPSADYEVHLFVGAGLFELFLCSVSFAAGKRGLLPVNCQNIVAGSRISAALATASQTSETCSVKMIYRPLTSIPS